MKAGEQNVLSRNSLWIQKLSEISIPWGRFALLLAIAGAIFLLGFVPTRLSADTAIEQRDAAQREVQLIQLENALGAATIDVQHGEFETARQTMSEFFTRLRAHLDAGPRSILSEMQRERLRPFLTQRDEIITLLARSDPTAADRVFAIYSSYKKARK